MARPLDDIDARLIVRLQSDGRVSNKELAAEVGLHPVHDPQLLAAPYVRPPRALRHDADWTAAVWACRKAPHATMFNRRS